MTHVLLSHAEHDDRDADLEKQQVGAGVRAALGEDVDAVPVLERVEHGVVHAAPVDLGQLLARDEAAGTLDGSGSSSASRSDVSDAMLDNLNPSARRRTRSPGSASGAGGWPSRMTHGYANHRDGTPSASATTFTGLSRTGQSMVTATKGLNTCPNMTAGSSRDGCTHFSQSTDSRPTTMREMGEVPLDGIGLPHL